MSENEMFEELEFKRENIADLYIVFRSKNRYIEFNLKEKNIAVGANEDDMAVYFTMQELQAINQKCKELEWIE